MQQVDHSLRKPQASTACSSPACTARLSDVSTPERAAEHALLPPDSRSCEGRTARHVHDADRTWYRSLSDTFNISSRHRADRSSTCEVRKSQTGRKTGRFGRQLALCSVTSWPQLESPSICLSGDAKAAGGVVIESVAEVLDDGPQLFGVWSPGPQTAAMSCSRVTKVPVLAASSARTRYPEGARSTSRPAAPISWAENSSDRSPRSNRFCRFKPGAGCASGRLPGSPVPGRAAPVGAGVHDLAVQGQRVPVATDSALRSQ